MGISHDVMVARIGLNSAAMADPDARVPLDTMRQLWHELSAEMAQPDFALRLSTLTHPSTYGLVGHLVMTCSTLGEALAMLQRYFGLLTDDGLFELCRNGSNVRIQLTLAPVEDILAWRCALEWSLGSLLACARTLTREALQPLEAQFNYPAPAHLSAYRDTFQCSLKFSALHTSLEFPESILTQPVFSSDRSLQPLLQSRVEDQVRTLTEHTSMAEKVRAFLRAATHGQNLNVSHAAKALGVSVRTLARRLATEATAFQTLHDEHRRETCCRMLAQTDHPIEEIAFLAGYSELSTFHRAFKRWTQKAPGEYRKVSRHNSPPVNHVTGAPGKGSSSPGS